MLTPLLIILCLVFFFAALYYKISRDTYETRVKQLEMDVKLLRGDRDFWCNEAMRRSESTEKCLRQNRHLRLALHLHEVAEKHRRLLAERSVRWEDEFRFPEKKAEGKASAKVKRIPNTSKKK